MFNINPYGRISRIIGEMKGPIRREKIAVDDASGKDAQARGFFETS